MNETTRTEALELLEEGEALFTLLGRLIYGAPERELITQFTEEKLYEDIPFVDESAAAEARAEFSAWRDEWLAMDANRAFTELRAEYTRIFVGLRKVLAPLWESVYFNRDRMVFQEETFQVRSMYRRYGLQIDKLQHEPDDHLCYELLFIAALFRDCKQRIEEGDRDAAEKTWADLRSFALFHPLTWVSQWNELVQENTKNGFYRGYASLVLHSLKKLEEVQLP